MVAIARKYLNSSKSIFIFFTAMAILFVSISAYLFYYAGANKSLTWLVIAIIAMAGGLFLSAISFPARDAYLEEKKR